jgi:hypothetical protein
MFTALPHKLLLPDKFEEEVIKLRERYTLFYIKFVINLFEKLLIIRTLLLDLSIKIIRILFSSQTIVNEYLLTDFMFTQKEFGYDNKLDYNYFVYLF